MPLFRYFAFVGSILTGILFVIDAYSTPRPPRPEASIDRSVLRIRSDFKLPPRVDFDTSAPRPQRSISAQQTIEAPKEYASEAPKEYASFAKVAPLARYVESAVKRPSVKRRYRSAVAAAPQSFVNFSTGLPN